MGFQRDCSSNSSCSLKPHTYSSCSLPKHRAATTQSRQSTEPPKHRSMYNTTAKSSAAKTPQHVQHHCQAQSRQNTAACTTPLPRTTTVAGNTNHRVRVLLGSSCTPLRKLGPLSDVMSTNVDSATLFVSNAPKSLST